MVNQDSGEGALLLCRWFSSGGAFFLLGEGKPLVRDRISAVGYSREKDGLTRRRRGLIIKKERSDNYAHIQTRR